ncbi:MAG: glutamate 5-kinase [Ilumatobacteraceae bacterium]
MRIVVKVGTSSLTDAVGVINHDAIARVCAQLAELRRLGHQVLLVTSGAVSAGVAALGMASRPTDVPTLQAIAAAGQSRLMEVYNRVFAEHGIVAAQVLLMPHDFVDRRQYLHARGALLRLLELGCVPVINENDAIASHEVRFGDNDRIAALLSHNVAADLLVLLTDTEGLYTADPRHDRSATLVSEVPADDPLLAVNATKGGTTRGSGGMSSKLSAARMASWSGVTSVIAAAARDDVLLDIAAGAAVGTTFRPRKRRLGARKLWIGFAAHIDGALVVDEGASRALHRGTSLLPAGVTEVVGSFHNGDVVEVRDPAGTAIARGMALLDAAVLRTVVGKRTADLPAHVAHEVIHRDDLIVLT